MRTGRPRNTFAKVSWTPQDVLDLCAEEGDLGKPTIGQARAFLKKHEAAIEGRMTSAGWDAIRALAQIDWAEGLQ